MLCQCGLRRTLTSKSTRKQLQNDEPLFAKRDAWITHPVFGDGTLLSVYRNHRGNPTGEVLFDDGIREVAALWLPSEVLQEWWKSKVDNFTFSDASPSEMDKPHRQFSRCVQCGKQFVNGKNQPMVSGFAFCNETGVTQGDCKRKWLERHEPACELPAPQPRTIIRKQLIANGKREEMRRPFSHSQSMPRKAANYCTDLGMYVQENWKPREGDLSSNYESIAAAYHAKAMKAWEEDRRFQREHRKTCDLNHHESKFLESGSNFGNSFEAWAESGMELKESFADVRKLGKMWEEASPVLRASITQYQCAEKSFIAKQAWKKRPRPIRICPNCGKNFAGRADQKHCSTNCRKRHFEKRKTSKEMNTCQQSSLEHREGKEYLL